MNIPVSPRHWLAAACIVLAVQLPLARAEIVGTGEMTAPAPADAERDKVQAFLERATVAQRLQAMGVSGVAAADRVAAMDQEEIHTLAQRIDSLPAGGNFSNSDIIIILLTVILLVLVL